MPILPVQSVAGVDPDARWSRRVPRRRRGRRVRRDLGAARAAGPDDGDATTAASTASERSAAVSARTLAAAHGPASRLEHAQAGRAGATKDQAGDPTVPARTAPTGRTPRKFRRIGAETAPASDHRGVDHLSEYLPMFLAEGREHLQELNLAVVRIEETPEDRTTVDEIFRIAHSLKGMSATMGFAGMAALTHEMEDVFELLRQRARRACSAPRSTCCSSAWTRSRPPSTRSTTTGSEAIEPDAADRAAARAGPRRRGPPRGRARPTRRRRAAGRPRARWPRAAASCRSRATLRDDVDMPAVRAYMVLAARRPSWGRRSPACRRPHDVDTFDGREVVAWLVSDRTDAELAAAAAGGPRGRGRARPSRPSPTRRSTASPRPVAPPRPAPRPRSSHHGSSTVRVDAERLDQLMHAMGELVLNRTQVEVLADQADVPGLAQAIQGLTRTSHALQAMVMQVRMIPVEAVLLRFPRLVRDLSVKLSKQVELELVGKDTELDRSVVDSLGDPLVHLIRNALDHGLESAGRARRGRQARDRQAEIAARHAGGNVVISVNDDGRGIDAAARRPQGARARPDRAEPRARSTSRAPPSCSSTRASRPWTSRSDISGRGVGMDAVRVAIRELGGEVTLTSEPGAGHLRRDPPAADAGDHVRADRARRRAPVRDPARPHRAHRPPRRPAGLARVAGRRMLVLSDGALPLVDARRAVRRHARRRRRLRGRRARQRRAAGVRGRRHWTASASWSRGRCRRRSPKAPPSREPPCSRTGRSP